MNIIPCTSGDLSRGQEEISSEDECTYSAILNSDVNAFKSYAADLALQDTWSEMESSSTQHLPAPLPEISEFLREETKARDTHNLQFSVESLNNKNKRFLKTIENKSCCGNDKNVQDCKYYETLVSCRIHTEPEKVKLKRPLKECHESVYVNTVSNKRTKSESGDFNPIEQNESFGANLASNAILDLESNRIFQTQEKDQECAKIVFENLDPSKPPNVQSGNTVDNCTQASFLASPKQNDIIPSLFYCEQPHYPNSEQEHVWFQNQSTVTHASENSFDREVYPGGNPAVSNDLLHGNFNHIKQEQNYKLYLNKKLPPGNNAVWNNFNSDTVNNHIVSYVNHGEICGSPNHQPQLPSRKFQLIGQTNPIDLKEITWQDAKQHTSQPDLGFLQLQTSNSLLDDIDLSEVDSTCMEHIEREYHKEAVKEMELACSLLKIPTDAEQWSEHHVDKWIMWTVHQCNLPVFDISLLRMSGLELCKLSATDMLSRVPTCGDILHARLRIWRSAAKMRDLLDSAEIMSNISKSSAENEKIVRSPKFSSGVLGMDNENASLPKEDTATLMKTNQTSSIHLWVFLKELLMKPQIYGRFIRWIDQEKGVFKIEDSVEVARLWGVRKNRPAMNYDKLSRSIRQYYKKGIIKKTAISQRLVYQFVNPALSL